MVLESGLPQVPLRGSLCPGRCVMIILILQERKLRLSWICDLNSGLLHGSKSDELPLHVPLIQTHLESGALKGSGTLGDSFIPFWACIQKLC